MDFMKCTNTCASHLLSKNIFVFSTQIYFLWKSNTYPHKRLSFLPLVVQKHICAAMYFISSQIYFVWNEIYFPHNQNSFLGSGFAFSRLLSKNTFLFPHRYILCGNQIYFHKTQMYFQVAPCFLPRVFQPKIYLFAAIYLISEQIYFVCKSKGNTGCFLWLVPPYKVSGMENLG